MSDIKFTDEARKIIEARLAVKGGVVSGRVISEELAKNYETFLTCELEEIEGLEGMDGYCSTLRQRLVELRASLPTVERVSREAISELFMEWSKGERSFNLVDELYALQLPTAQALGVEEARETDWHLLVEQSFIDHEAPHDYPLIDAIARRIALHLAPSDGVRAVGKRFLFEVTQDDCGILSFRSEGEGFHTFEALGFMEWKCEDIRAQIRGEVKPDVVKRTSIVPEAPR